MSEIVKKQKVIFLGATVETKEPLSELTPVTFVGVVKL